mmetsp:Transcript_9479/g.16344  ORF Transcript_9479/g.16344 Transcript_9479/m.16344 type:complete len:127 (-) Transcript_9479:448-828(-)
MSLPLFGIHSISFSFFQQHFCTLAPFFKMPEGFLVTPPASTWIPVTPICAAISAVRRKARRGLAVVVEEQLNRWNGTTQRPFQLDIPEVRCPFLAVLLCQTNVLPQISYPEMIYLSHMLTETLSGT